MKRSLRNDILSFLAESGQKRRPVTARNEEEAGFLSQWLAAPVNDDAGSGGPVLSPRENLDDLIESCTACGNIKEKRAGYGNGSSGVMIILHAPRLVDRVERDILRKESIDLLQKMLSAIKLNMDTCYITNMIKCEMEDILTRPSEMVEHCQKILTRELEVIAPRVVLVMGDMQPIQKMVHGSSGMIWFSLEHPLTLIKNPELKHPAWKTLQMVQTEISESPV